MVAAAPLIGLALSAAGGAMNYAQASAANRASSNATKNWIAYQKQNQLKQTQRDDANRKKAQAAREGTLDKITDVQNTVDSETQRLSGELNTDNTMAAAPEATVNDALLTGQGQNPSMKEYAAGRLFNAAQEARKKTAALAAMQAYTGSQHGLQNTNQQALTEGSNEIDLYNNYRRGDLSVYGLAKGVSPQQVSAPSGGMGTAISQLGGAITGLGKDGLSGLF